MGCDIHVMAEIKIDSNDEWLFFKELRVNRDYELFSKMAPIVGRGTQCAISIASLPQDASKLSMYMLHRYADHTYGHLNKNEIIQLIKWIKENYPMNSFRELIDFIEDPFEYDFFDKRIIFGFDS